ncbi:hypothetical protein CR970_04625 [Candidatus Saccharibacteria bacterium]|nr:MAG: hypothetical protein CR970_04625 [Candidatus Saccharibacteria bacterium]
MWYSSAMERRIAATKEQPHAPAKAAATFDRGPATDMRDYIIASGDKLTGEQHDHYTLRLRDIARPDRPRERLALQGPESLNTAELVAVLWGVGTRKEDVLEMARRAIKEYGEQALMHEKDSTKLSKALGIPLVKAQQLIAALELGRRTYQKRGGLPIYIHSAAQAHSHLRSIGASQKEHLRGLYLNSRYQVIHDEVISIGSLTANIVHPREVFGPAIEHNAVGVILAHNHPSGSLSPTQEDLEITKQLIAAGALLGIQLIDHLVVNESHYKSIIMEASRL